MAILSLDEFSSRDVKVMKAKARLDKERDLSLVASKPTPTVQPWRAVCLTCDFVENVTGGVAAGEAADDHIVANHTHRVKLQANYTGQNWFDVYEMGWRRSLAARSNFQNDDIRR